MFNDVSNRKLRDPFLLTDYLSRTWKMDNGYIPYFSCRVLYSSMPQFNNGLTKLPLQLCHRCRIKYHFIICIFIPVYALKHVMIYLSGFDIFNNLVFYNEKCHLPVSRARHLVVGDNSGLQDDSSCVARMTYSLSINVAWNNAQQKDLFMCKKW